ncbi:hypothetical protein ACIOTI_31770 [Streptomyces sp. NPDC087843]|uniref:hypothetical protein n=1 Tax=Streptomyces sp. NPDC087843 TaxID=3365804 RepID=UPI0037FFD264
MTTMFTTTTHPSRGMRHRRPRRSAVPFLAPLLIWAGAAGVRDWVESLDGYEALAVLPDGRTWQTSGCSRHGS